MSEYPRQIVIRNPIWAFMEYCEVYCTGACCGFDAFEVHPALLLRKVIDDNLNGKDGHALFKRAWQQLTELIDFVDSVELVSIHNELPFWFEEQTDLPNYWLPQKDAPGWLHSWNDAFEKASKYGGLDKDSATS